MSKFTDAIQNFREKVDNQTTLIYKRSCRGVSYEIAGKTPCSTGKLLGQWSPSAGMRDQHDYEGGESAWKKVGGGFEKDEAIAAANEAQAMANLTPRIEAHTAMLNKDVPYYFTNHTSYARQAEYEGWKKTGPYYMVLESVHRWHGIVYRIARRIRG